MRATFQLEWPIFVRGQIGTAPPATLPLATLLEGRCVVIHIDVDAFLKGGIFLMSACLFSGEGLSERILALACRIALWLGAMDRPFTEAPAWYLTKAELAEVGVCRRRRESSPTCANGDRVLDSVLLAQSHPQCCCGRWLSLAFPLRRTGQYFYSSHSSGVRWDILR